MIWDNLTYNKTKVDLQGRTYETEFLVTINKNI